VIGSTKKLRKMRYLTISYCAAGWVPFFYIYTSYLVIGPSINVQGQDFGS